MSRRRSSASATTPLISESPTMGRTRTSPTMPRASPFFSSGTRSDTCQRMAAFCIIEPVKEMSWPAQRSRKFRYRRALKESESGMLRDGCEPSVPLPSQDTGGERPASPRLLGGLRRLGGGRERQSQHVAEAARDQCPGEAVVDGDH